MEILEIRRFSTKPRHSLGKHASRNLEVLYYYYHYSIGFFLFASWATVEVTSPRGREEPHKEPERRNTGEKRERERRLVRPWRFAIINCSVLGTSKETKCARCLSLRYLSVPAAGEDPWTRFQWTFLNGRRCPLANIIPLHLRESRVPLTIASRLSPPRLILCRASGRTRVLLSLNSICASLNAAPFAIIHARTSVWGGRNGEGEGPRARVDARWRGRETYYRGLELYTAPSSRGVPQYGWKINRRDLRAAATLKLCRVQGLE